jgi:hypothetical protein
MSRIIYSKGSRRRTFAGALLASTILVGGGVAWAEAGSTASVPPLSLPAVANPTGFADLVTKVKPAIVNIAGTEELQNVSASDQQALPPNAAVGGRGRRRSAG